MKRGIELRKASPWASEMHAALATGPAGVPGSEFGPDRSRLPDAYDRSEA